MQKRLLISQSSIYRILKISMEKICWKQVRHNDRNGIVPHERWGHCCCVVDDEVVIFGGYADSNYMNDVWSFNTITMEWIEIETVGEIPSPRSNCSMSYDKDNNKIVVFGGGGPNKARYNSINILDWKTKQWIQINPNTNLPAPWERTYHTSELFYPYLVIFGGEGVGDLQDLWIFDLANQQWKEVITPKIKPCARRFHSSARVGNQFFIIAGCYSKYRCLNDIFSIDLTELIQTGRTDQLIWKERKMKNNTFLTRWGHTSVVYGHKIYVFGGRFSNDLSDIQVIDTEIDQVSTLKVVGELPRARRRHSACFLGKSMLIFGGFNGQYFNDLNYINIKQSKQKLSIKENINQESLEKLRKLKTIEFEPIKTITGDIYEICIGLLINRFRNLYSFDNFLKDINQKYSQGELNRMLMCIYKGYGQIDKQFTYKYGICIYDNKQQMQAEFKKEITLTDRQLLTNCKRLRQVEPLILLDNQIYQNYLEIKRTEECFYDITFNINDSAYFRANKALIALNSKYFFSIISQQFQESSNVIKMFAKNILLFQTFLYYLSSGVVIASKHENYHFWVELIEIAEYYCAFELTKICQRQLESYVTDSICQQLLSIALEMDLKHISLACAQRIINKMVSKDKQDHSDNFPQLTDEFMSKKRQILLKQVYGTLRFDILQRKIDSQQKQARSVLKKTQSDNSQYQQQQKQNNQIKN